MPHDTGSLSLFDYAIIAIYMLAMIVMGFFIGKKQKNTEDFFLAGRSMSWWPVALALFASLFSTISYVAMPGEAFNYGMNMGLVSLLLLFQIPVVVLVFLRFFYQLRIWTAYEYLERRFDVRVRTVGSIAFLVLRCFYLGVVLYASALVIQPITGWDLTFAVIVVGICSTVYIAMGGAEAVIWTDVVQTVILIGGIFIIIGLVAFEVDGGVLAIWNQANAMGHGYDLSKASGMWDWNFNQRLTVWVWLIGFLPACISPATDQVNLQRCLSTKSLKSAGGAMFASAMLTVFVTFVFYFAGLSMLIFFKKLHPDILPANAKGDYAFTYFVSHHLPGGLRGLLIAALLAAVMSTLSSVINSLAMVFVKDLYQRSIRPNRSEAHYMRISKGLTWLWGAVTIGLSLAIIALFHQRDIPLLEVSTVVLGFFGSIMLGVFVLGLMSYRATAVGTIIGLVSGSIFSAWVTWHYYLQPPPGERLSFLWCGLVALGSVILFGYVASLFTLCPPRAQVGNYVIWSQWFGRRQKAVLP